MPIIAELKRRNVLRVAAAYVVAAWLVIQVVETLFPVFGFGDEAVRVVVIVLAAGIVPTVIAAWAFELTPEGLRRERGKAGDAPLRLRDGRRIDALIMITLALACGYFAVDKFVFSRVEPQPSPVELATVMPHHDASLAVLPFVDLSVDASQAYLSDGIAEELINLLSKVPELRVISRTSAFAFREQDLTVGELAKKLNVDYVLEGSVRKSGPQLRITAQLIDARTDTHIWAESYQRQLDDIFVIQDDIARSVLPQLQLRLFEQLPPTTEADPRAYALYLQALQFYLQRSAEGIARAIDYAERSLDIDADYAPAWTLLASAYINQAHARIRPFVEGFELADQAAQKALEADPGYALAHSTRAWIAMAYANDYHAAADSFREARNLAPNNSIVLTNNAVLAIRLGRLEMAQRLIERSLALDPANTVTYGNLAEILLRLGRIEEADAAARQALDLNPENDTARSLLALVAIVDERPTDAINVAATVENAAARELILAMANHDLGRNDAAVSSFSRLESEHADSAAYFLAIACAWFGRNDEAFAWLGRAIGEGQSYFGLKTEPFLDGLAGDPRWDAILSKAGLAEAQIADIVI